MGISCSSIKMWHVHGSQMIILHLTVRQPYCSSGADDVCMASIDMKLGMQGHYGGDGRKGRLCQPTGKWDENVLQVDIPGGERSP